MLLLGAAAVSAASWCWPASLSAAEDPFAPASQDPYAEARAKALAFMASPAPAKSTAPHNWCHCGACESIGDATQEALAIMQGKDCPCGDCPCKPGVCPSCPVWRRLPDYPVNLIFLYEGDKVCGVFDSWRQYYWSAAGSHWIAEGRRPAWAPPLPDRAEWAIPAQGGCGGGCCGRGFRR